MTPIDNTADNPPTPPLRPFGYNFGYARHNFPKMTPTEGIFVWAMGICGLVAVVAVNIGIHRNGASLGLAILAFCACVMGCTVGYWLGQEPRACLDLLVYSSIWLPFALLFALFRRDLAANKIRWPQIVIFCTRAFGAIAFFGSISSFPEAMFQTIFPGWALSWMTAPLGGLLYYSSAWG